MCHHPCDQIYPFDHYCPKIYRYLAINKTNYFLLQSTKIPYDCQNDSTKSSEYQVLGPAIDSKAPEPTKLVPGMNGPAWELELVPVPGQPIYLRPEICCSKNRSQPLSISLKRGFFTVTTVFSLTLRRLHSPTYLQESFHYKSTYKSALQSFPTQFEVFCTKQFSLTLWHLHSPTNLQEGFHCKSTYKSALQSFPHSN